MFLRRDVRLRCFGFEVMDGLQSLTHGRRFQHPRSTDDDAPEVRNLNPISLNLRLDSNPPANNRAEHGDRGDRYIVGRALQPVGDVSDPCREFVRQERWVERIHFRQVVRQLQRLTPRRLGGGVTGLWIGLVKLFSSGLDKRLKVGVAVFCVAVGSAGHIDLEVVPTPTDHDGDRIAHSVVPLATDLTGLQQRNQFVVGLGTALIILLAVRGVAGCLAVQAKKNLGLVSRRILIDAQRYHLGNVTTSHLVRRRVADAAGQPHQVAAVHHGFVAVE